MKNLKTLSGHQVSERSSEARIFLKRSLSGLIRVAALSNMTVNFAKKNILIPNTVTGIFIFVVL